ncbi:hypothetical protein DN400_20335 [Bacillus sp. AR8-1]|uniref:hypothetical protein n=1 Tax=Bacillus sp. AR8-1 TaxID=2217826 RepID=UPI0011C7C6D5|nr:hypothetical protein [Bacillus sp. AR8-1]TXR71839.1 hypothetical protein DN400_20335 [Bacillus sp. AR8-1]
MDVLDTINFSDEVKSRLVKAIVQGLDKFREHVVKVEGNATNNHLPDLRGDEINECIKNFVLSNPHLSLKQEVVRSGRNWRKHIKVIVNDTLVIFKKVGKVDKEKLPWKSKEIFDEEEVSEYIQQYASVNKKYRENDSTQLKFDLNDDKPQHLEIHPNVQNEYSTFAVVTYELAEDNELVNIAIGVPSDTVDSWLKYELWSEFITVSHKHATQDFGSDEDTETPNYMLTLKEDIKEDEK